MISHELQYKIHLGDSEAFKTLFSGYGRAVYCNALCGLSDVAGARSVTKRVFLRLQHELMESPGPIDVDARVAALISDELDRYTAGKSTEHPAGTAHTWETCVQGVQAAAASPVPSGTSPAPADKPVVSVEPPMAGPCDAAASEPPSSTCHTATPEPDASAPCATDPAAPDRLPPRYDAAPPQRGRSRLGITLLWLMVCLLALLLVWLMLDIVMHLQLLPRVDLGYTWFNHHVFRLFSPQ